MSSDAKEQSFDDDDVELNVLGCGADILGDKTEF